MNKVKCSGGHFFDLDRYEACPLCGGMAVTGEKRGESQKIMNLIDKISEDDFEGTILLDENADNGTEDIYVQDENPAAEKSVKLIDTGKSTKYDLQETVLYDESISVEPPTGWLVCVKGPHYGQVFVCKTGKNKIGRNEQYDISLMNDMSVTRDVHAILIYEPKQSLFYLQNGTGDGLVYLNEELLFSHAKIKAYDKIQIGNAEFVFVPLCGEQFTWNDYMN